MKKSKFEIFLKASVISVVCAYSSTPFANDDNVLQTWRLSSVESSDVGHFSLCGILQTRSGRVMHVGQKTQRNLTGIKRNSGSTTDLRNEWYFLYHTAKNAYQLINRRSGHCLGGSGSSQNCDTGAPKDDNLWAFVPADVRDGLASNFHIVKHNSGARALYHNAAANQVQVGWLPNLSDTDFDNSKFRVACY